MPERVQLSRRKGYRKPENAVVVSRPSKWGNPFAERIPHGETLQPTETRALLVKQFRMWLVDGAKPEEVVRQTPLRTESGQLWISHMRPTKRPNLRDVRAELAGKDLACWCPLDQPCHADVLLKIANPPTPVPTTNEGETDG
ncbi:DUF4326 domain-containing protein [Plantibacter sp. YIM 135249]|uniref:DUF4326 domain-containing protein n=1 Tax=Plantibacter sp. YIM 135249 TaxID=3423918 RepID=UPI003D348D40